MAAGGQGAVLGHAGSRPWDVWDDFCLAGAVWQGPSGRGRLARNADDARATRIAFCLDHRQHPTGAAQPPLNCCPAVVQLLPSLWHRQCAV
ncbi:hypothetical protein HaLaN_23385 [Haematococcus lacustris]|uniref:Uncharacterized protein n=1 Tax=Haematococcus lacustris TaxID=44745 RepID=A0A699ZSX0_HAELA|nr:hypothetical protein HaLaN_23385 [Haematococcus lacustris]